MTSNSQKNRNDIIRYVGSVVLCVVPTFLYLEGSLPSDFFSVMMSFLASIFGFGGLIVTFVFGELLNEKSKLEQYSRENQLSGLKAREEYKMSLEQQSETLKALLKEYAEHGEEISTKIGNNEIKLNEIYNIGIQSLTYFFLSLFAFIMLNMYRNQYDFLLIASSFFFLFSGFFSIIIIIKMLLKSNL